MKSHIMNKSREHRGVMENEKALPKPQGICWDEKWGSKRSTATPPNCDNDCPLEEGS
jgi:hypothetical protein